MNIGRLTKLRDHLLALHENKKPEFGFNMGEWFENDRFIYDWAGHACKSVGCIAGHAVALFQEEPISAADDLESEAAQLLEISEDDASDLFIPTTINLVAVTPKEAAAAIDRLIAGKDPWPQRRKRRTK
jgi:hypothetical protein